MEINLTLDERMVSVVKLALDSMAAKASDQMDVSQAMMIHAHEFPDIVANAQKTYLDNLALYRDCEAALRAIDRAK